ncbi:MAG: glycoside hydrolase family 88 protein [Chloroflexota bacterium]
MTAQTDTQFETVIENSLLRLRCLTNFEHGRFPNYSKGSQYVWRENDNWLAAFWPGLLWLAYSASHQQQFCDTAVALLPTFAHRLDRQVHITHDLGFLYTLSARAQWQCTGDVAARDLALRAATQLLGRYRQPGRYIQAWGAVGDAEKGGQIIADTMMNIPLLFWAGAETGDSRFHEAAQQHTRHSINYLMRPDGSSHHTFFFNQQTGQPDHPATHQGYSDDSWWARGHAWLIYGFALAAAWCDNETFLAAARRAANTFYAALPPSKVPPWDFRLPAEAPAYLDSSAGAIAACGMLRIAALDGDAQMRQQAESLVAGLLQTCLEDDPQAQGLLQHGALHIPKMWAPDAYLIFGDYFFLEALLTLTNNAPDFWGPGGN